MRVSNFLSDLQASQSSVFGGWNKLMRNKTSCVRLLQNICFCLSQEICIHVNLQNPSTNISWHDIYTEHTKLQLGRIIEVGYRIREHTICYTRRVGQWPYSSRNRFALSMVLVQKTTTNKTLNTQNPTQQPTCIVSLLLNIPVNNFFSHVGTEPPLPWYYQYFG